MECLSIPLALLITAGWMAATSYEDYLVAQLSRLARLDMRSAFHSVPLALQFLNLPWNYGQWVISSVVLFVVSLLLGMINFWVLFIPALISAVALAVALFRDVQQIEQITVHLPPHEPPRPIFEKSHSIRVKLIGIRGEHANRTLEFDVEDEEITIGRNSTNRVRLTETSVSRHHARIVCADHRWFVQDLESKTGVYVNGKRIEGGRRIHQHDKIRIGSTEYEFLHR